MITNVLQKPAGAIAVLAAAIGGPYAAFETDAGSVVRRMIAGSSQEPTPQSDSDPASLGLLNQQPGLQTNPTSFGATYSSYPIPTTNSNGYTNPSAAGQPITSGGNITGGLPGYGGSQVLPSNLNQPNGSPPQSQVPFSGNGVPPQSSVVYGPATITPLGMYGGNAPIYAPNQNMQGAYPEAPPNQYANVETRQGPAQVIPGGTYQLWDYTVGVPSLQQLQRQPTAIGGGNVQDLREVLRFDVTPVWLTQRFSRVTTVLSNVQLDGMRVPLITGTQTTDLAGTLTYYFDSRQSVRRINLHGLTGDPSQLANLMVQFYGLKPEQSLGGQLYTYRWNNQVNSVLHLSPAPIVYSGADHSKFVVFLELNQADSNMGLSQEASEILNNLQSTRRW